MRRAVREEKIRARSPDRKAPRRHHARPHAGAAAYRDLGGGELPAREAGTRAARLRRSHRQDAGDAQADFVGLGALQARPRRRPRADRRGAGYEPAAMGDRRPHHRRIHRRRRRARRDRPHHLRGRRREAVDLLVPGRRAARIRPAPPRAGAEVHRCRTEIRSGLVHLFVPFGPGDPAIGRPCVSRRSDLSQHPFAGHRISHPSLARRRRPQPDRAVDRWPKPTRTRTSRAGARRSTACR